MIPSLATPRIRRSSNGHRDTARAGHPAACFHRLVVREADDRGNGAVLRRRPESDIRDEFVLALNVSITDAIYQTHPGGLKHDIFALPDPDVAVIARKLKYDSALQVAERVRTAFRAEAARLVAKAGDNVR
jgi:hypothetical protein